MSQTASPSQYAITPPHTRWTNPDGTPTNTFYRYILGRLGSGQQVPGTLTDNVWTGTNNFTGPFEINGVTITFPGGGALAGLGSNNAWTGNNNFTAGFLIGGVVQTFPGSGLIVGTTDAGALTNKTINDPTNTIGGQQLVGSATNDAASAGNVGELISATVLAGAAVPLTSTVAADIATISLTAGDWDVFGEVVFVPAASTVPTVMSAWTSTTTAAFPTLPNAGGITSLSLPFTTGAVSALSAGMQRISVAAPTTVYLSARATFTTSTLAAYGFIGARRRR